MTLKKREGDPIRNKFADILNIIEFLNKQFNSKLTATINNSFYMTKHQLADDNLLGVSPQQLKVDKYSTSGLQIS